MPPPGARWIWTSSMKLRMKKIPRPLALSRFSGASGSGSSSGSKPSPWSRTRMSSSVGAADGVMVKSSSTSFAASNRLPCLIALITDSRTATPTQCWASSSRPSILPS